MDAFSWLGAPTLRCTVVLSVALGLGLLLRRSSAVARHRLLTLTAVSLLALPFLAWVLPSLELPLALPGLEPSSSAPVANSSTPAETMSVLGEPGPPAPGPESAHATAQDAAPRPGGVDYAAALAAGAVAAWRLRSRTWDGRSCARGGCSPRRVRSTAPGSRPWKRPGARSAWLARSACSRPTRSRRRSPAAGRGRRCSFLRSPSAGPRTGEGWSCSTSWCT